MKKLKDKQIKINYTFSLFNLLRKISTVSIIVILLTMLFYKNKDYEELISLNKAETSKLKLFKNEKGELIAKIKAFETQRTKDFLEFSSKDSLTIALQNEVRSMKRYLRKQGSITKFTTESSVETSVKTKVDSTNTVYTSSFNLGGWVFGNSRATKDSTTYKIQYRDEYSLSVGLEPKGFLGLGKGIPFAQLTSSNPYNVVKTLKTYQVSLPEKKRFGVGPNISLTPSFNNNKISINTTIGVGLQYSLLQF